jgi:hypothetical protein
MRPSPIGQTGWTPSRTLRARRIGWRIGTQYSVLSTQYCVTQHSGRLISSFRHMLPQSLMSSNQHKTSVTTSDGRKHDLVVVEARPNKWKTRQVVRGKYIEGTGETAAAAAETWLAKYESTFSS